MATVLIEIGCEELPASACREAEAAAAGALPAADRSRAEPRPDHAAAARAARRGRARADAGRVGQGPAGGDAGEGRRGIRQAPRRRGRGARGARRLPRGRVSGQGPRRGAPGAGGRHPARARVLEDDALERRRASLSAAGSLDARDDRLGEGRRRGLVRPPLHVGCDRHPGCLRPTSTPCASADVEPDALERRKQIVDALDDLGGWTDPNGVLGEVVFLVEKPVVIEGRFDERYLQLPSRVIETTIQHHIRAFPLGENRFAFVANGGDPETVRAGVENVVEGRLEDASFTFERDVKVGIDSLAERLGRDHVLPGRRLVRGQDRAAGEARRGARRRRRGARGGEAREGGPGLRARAGVHRARGAHRRRVRAARRLSRGGERRDRRAVPARRGRRAAAADRDRAASSRRRTRSTRSTSPSGSGNGRRAHATRTGSGGPRSGSTGSRRRGTSRSRGS